MLEEKRVHPRKSMLSEGWIGNANGDSWSSINLLDISTGGIAFISKEKMEADAFCILRIHLPGTSRLINVVGQITHSIEHSYLAGYRTGAHFARIEPNDLAMIEWFIDGKALVPT